jgi:ATP/ADP translocase
MIAPRPLVSSSIHQYYTASNSLMTIKSAIETELGVSFRLFAKKAVPVAVGALAASVSNSTSDDQEELPQEEYSSSSSSLLPLMDHNMLSPRGWACLYMALAMALHFGGYEFARSSALALLTSKENGFGGSAAAFPLAMALVSPFSVILLMLYGNVLDKSGPKVALRQSTLGSILTLLTAGLGLLLVANGPSTTADAVMGSMWWSKLLVGLTFVFQNSYAHLLYAQQWSFLGSVMTPLEGSRWFASVAGLSSLASAFTGTTVEWLVARVGLPGLLLCTTVTLSGSLLLGERAYQLAEEHNFDPADEIQQKKQDKEEKKTQNRVSKAIELFGREPKLKALFAEVLSCQSLSTILNVCFVTSLKATIVDDVARAAWTGKFYAAVNAVSGSFQFIIMPVFLKNMEPSVAWRIMPMIPVASTLFQALQTDPALSLLAFSFFAAKCMDYSFRGVGVEMVYVPLDFESRYVGKEIIGVFGNRFGKSGMSLLLSGLTFAFGNFGIRELSLLSTGASAMWLASGWNLSQLVPKQAEAQKIVEERRRHKKSSEQEKEGSASKGEDTKPKQS